MSKTIIIDPGHGGFDPGAVFGNRREKDDTLRLALAVGRELEDEGYNVIYTRKDDRYDSPYDKAQIANNAGGDLFLSFHRNFAERPDLYQGVQALVYGQNPTALRVAKDVNEELERIGFENIGIEERKELVVLRRTNMPAVLLEVGFINSSVDNKIYDEKFSEMVDAIADGIKSAFPANTMRATNREPEMPQNQNMPMNDNMNMNGGMNTSNDIDNMNRPADRNNATSMSDSVAEDMRRSIEGVRVDLVPNKPAKQEPRMWYYVQVGLFRYPENAVYLMEQLTQQGYPNMWKRVAGLIGVWVGPMDSLDEAVDMQRRLQADGYETLIVTDDCVNKL